MKKRRPRDLEGNRIAGCSNDAAIWSKQSNVLEAKELQGTQTRAATDPLVLEKNKLYGTQIRYGKQL